VRFSAYSNEATVTTLTLPAAALLLAHAGKGELEARSKQ